MSLVSLENKRIELMTNSWLCCSSAAGLQLLAFGKTLEVVVLVWDYVFYNLSMAWPGFSFQTAGIDGQRISKKVTGNNNEQIYVIPCPS